MKEGSPRTRSTSGDKNLPSISELWVLQGSH